MTEPTHSLQLAALVDSAARARRVFMSTAMAVGTAVLIVCAESVFPTTRGIAGVRLSVHASVLAAVALAASAMLYIADWLIREHVLGRAAGMLAAMGASVLFGASLARWWEVHWLLPGTLQFSVRYEMLTWFAALCVYGYLWTENVYQRRCAGGFLLSCVLATLTVAAWLIGVAPSPDTTFVLVILAYLHEAAGLSAAVALAALVVLVALTGVSLRRAFRADDSSRPFLRAYAWTAVLTLCALTMHLALTLVLRLLASASIDANVHPWELALWCSLALAFAAWRLRGGAAATLSRWMVAALAIGGALGAIAS